MITYEERYSPDDIRHGTIQDITSRLLRKLKVKQEGE